MIARNLIDALAGTRHEGDTRAASAQLAHERETEARGAPRDGNSEILHTAGVYKLKLT
jgi:hypothetical protein